MVYEYAIRFDTYEDYKNKYNCVEDLMDRWYLMICPKDVAEKILGVEVLDNFESNVRCTNCGSNDINKFFSFYLKGFIEDNGADKFPKFIPESDKFSEKFLDRYECGCCGAKFFIRESF